MRNVWKRAGAFALSMLVAFSISVTAQASTINVAKDTLDKAYDSSKSKFDAKTVSQITDNVTGVLMGEADATKLSPSGAGGGLSIAIVTGTDYENIVDKTVKPIMTEFVKSYLKARSGAKSGTTAEQVEGIYYGMLKGGSSGNVTFKLEDKFSGTFTGNSYALVLRYTGSDSDTDGYTAQYAKISTNGKVEAHFNAYSPFAIIVTSEENLQQIVNTFYHEVGTDAKSTTPAATTTTNTATVQSAPVTNTVVSAPANTTTQSVATQSTQTSTVVSTANPDIVIAQPQTTSSAAATAAPVATSSTSSATTSSSSAAGCYPAYNGGDTSIVEALKACGETNTSFKHRSQIAAANGISGYRGSSDQNDQLVSLIKKGKLKKA